MEDHVLSHGAFKILIFFRSGVDEGCRSPRQQTEQSDIRHVDLVESRIVHRQGGRRPLDQIHHVDESCVAEPCYSRFQVLPRGVRRLSEPEARGILSQLERDALPHGIEGPPSIDRMLSEILRIHPEDVALNITDRCYILGSDPCADRIWHTTHYIVSLKLLHQARRQIIGNILIYAETSRSFQDLSATIG